MINYVISGYNVIHQPLTQFAYIYGDYSDYRKIQANHYHIGNCIELEMLIIIKYVTFTN